MILDHGPELLSGFFPKTDPLHLFTIRLVLHGAAISAIAELTFFSVHLPSITVQ